MPSKPVPVAESVVADALRPWLLEEWYEGWDWPAATPAAEALAKLAISSLQDARLLIDGSGCGQ